MSKPAGIRTCGGCSGKALQSELFKFGTGRHVYLHWDPKCFSLATKKRAFDRTLRRKFSELELYGIKKDFERQIKYHLPPTGSDGDGTCGPRQNIPT